LVYIQTLRIMTSEEKKPAGKKKRTIKSVTDDLMNGAWNNLDLSRSSKKALTNAGLIILFGAKAAAFFILKKK
jgi:hypothetical protein